MPSAELTSTQAPREPAGDPTALCLRTPRIAADSHRADFEALAHPEAVSRETSAQARAYRSRGPAAFHATGLCLRRALADSARAWALAAGAPPDLCN